MRVHLRLKACDFFSSALHKRYHSSTGCTQLRTDLYLREVVLRVHSRNWGRDLFMKVLVEVCPLCNGTGWKDVGKESERRVTRCDCRLQARAETLLAAARIPKRYEHCELSSYTTDFPGAHASL